jgi:hypothetical protein
MKITNTKIVAAFSIIAIASFTASKIVSLQRQIQNLENAHEKEKNQEEKLGQYAINMMYSTSAKTKISDAKKQILARAIVRVSNDVFELEEHKKAFVAVLAIESEFERSAQSPTGPRGLSQVAKSAFSEGMANCGIDNFTDEDVWETDINLYAGACYFRALLEKANDPYVAIVAYNQGPNSKDYKSYAKHGRMDNVEALKYVARFNFLKRSVPDNSIAPNAPAIQIGPVVNKVTKSSK